MDANKGCGDDGTVKCARCDSEFGFFNGFITLTGMICAECRRKPRGPRDMRQMGLVLVGCGLLALLVISMAVWLLAPRFLPSLPAGLPPMTYEIEQAVANGCEVVIKNAAAGISGEGSVEWYGNGERRYARISVLEVKILSIEAATEKSYGFSGGANVEFIVRAAIRANVTKLDRAGQYLYPVGVSVEDGFYVYRAEGMWKATVSHSLTSIY